MIGRPRVVARDRIGAHRDDVLAALEAAVAAMAHARQLQAQLPRPARPTCAALGCSAIATLREWCRKHYDANRRSGGH